MLHRILALVVPIAVVSALVLGGGVILLSPFAQPDVSARAATSLGRPRVAPAPQMPVCSDSSREGAALAALGLDRKYARVGSAVDWAQAPPDARRGAFVVAGARSPATLAKALVSQPLRQMLTKHLGAEVVQHLNTDDFVAIQPLKSIDLPGNHGQIDGQVFVSPRPTQPGEVLWVYVGQDDCSPQRLAILAVCANYVQLPQLYVVE